MSAVASKQDTAFNRYQKWVASENLYSNGKSFTHLDLVFDLLSHLTGVNYSEQDIKDYIRRKLEVDHPESENVSVRKYSLLFNRVLANELLAYIKRDLGDFIDVDNEVVINVTYKKLEIRIQGQICNDYYHYEGVMGVHTNYLLFDHILNELKNTLNYKLSPVLNGYYLLNSKEHSKYNPTDEELKEMCFALNDKNISDALRLAMRNAKIIADFIAEQLPKVHIVIGIQKSKVVFKFKINNDDDWIVLDNSDQIRCFLPKEICGGKVIQLNPA